MESGKVYIQDKTGATKMIGTYNAREGIFMSLRWPGKHRMKLRNEWGIDAGVLNDLAEDNARVRIRDMENGIEYWCWAKDLKEQGRVKSYGPHGKQVFMEVEKWEARSV